MRKSVFRQNDYFLAVAFATIITPIMLLAWRAVDDNRLTSWHWVFAGIDEGGFFFVLCIGLAAAFLFSRCTPVTRFRPVFLFPLLFLVASLFWREPEVIIDAGRYFSQAKHVKIYGEIFFFKEWGREIFAWTDMPLVPFLYGLVLKYLGETRIFVQLVSTAFFAGTAVLTYWIGKILWDESLGACAGVLLLGFPYLLTQVPLMLVDVPTMFFLTLAVFTFMQALRRGGWKMILAAALSLFLALIVKYSTWLLLSVLVVVFLVHLRSDPKTIMKRTAGVALIASVLFGLYAVSMHDVMIGQLGFLQSYQKPGLKRWGESYLSTFFFQIHPFLTVAAVYSAYVALKKRDARYLIVSSLVILLILLQIKRIRYTLPIFPMIALMAAYGLREIRNKEVQSFTVYCLVNSSIIISLFGFLPFLQSMSCANLERAGEFLNSLAVKEIEVVTLPQEEMVNPAIAVPHLDLFAEGNILYHDTPVPESVMEATRTSPLRFTWELPTPPFYKDGGGNRRGVDALVVISGRCDDDLPETQLYKKEQYSKEKEFVRTSGVFGYQTFVRVYY